MPWLLVALFATGGGALYFWKKANPGQKLLPDPPSPRPIGTGNVIAAKRFGNASITVYSDGTANVTDPTRGLEFFATTSKPPQLLQMVRGEQAEAVAFLRSIG